MKDEDIQRAVLRRVHAVAPEADLATVAPDADLRDALDLDSMDVLKLVRGLHEELGVDIPESDYRRVITLRGCAEYLAERLRGAST
jgi:acyl carrier protein